MESYKKASLSMKVWRDYIIKISLVGTVSLAGLVLAIASIISGGYIFALCYLVAFCLGFSYVIIRINTALPTYIATDGEKLMLSVWNNGVFPYKVDGKPSFIADFIPERVRLDEIEFSELDRIYIGSKRYLKKTLDEAEYPEILSALEEDKHIDTVLKKMDFEHALRFVRHQADQIGVAGQYALHAHAVKAHFLNFVFIPAVGRDNRIINPEIERAGGFTAVFFERGSQIKNQLKLSI